MTNAFKSELMSFANQVGTLARLLQLPETQLSLPFSNHIEDKIDNVSCLLLCGDNLHALSLLSHDYTGLVDFCYIDPPYNTGSKFIYHDSRHSQEGGLWGKHTDWMSFMLPRLVLARNLLNESGVLAVSIDDYEYSQLKVLLDHIFMDDNHLGTIVVNRSKNGRGSKRHIATNHEYVLLFGKSNKSELLGLPESDFNSYNREDDHGKFKLDGLFRKKGAASLRHERPNMYYPLYYDSSGCVYTDNNSGRLKEVYPLDSKGVERRWLWGRDKANNESWKLFASSNGVIYVKNYLTEKKRVKVRSIWDSSLYLTNSATNEIVKIYGKKVFETPKPLALIEDLIKCTTKKDALILDFFAGTATTAHAAHNVNELDGGSRKVILVEQPVRVEANHLAASKGFEKITDITEYRLAYLTSLNNKYVYKTINL